MVYMRHEVPQGSILDPVLFLVFINDLPLYVSSSNIDLYADDTTISSSVDSENMKELQETLNKSVAEAENWAWQINYLLMRRRPMFC